MTTIKIPLIDLDDYSAFRRVLPQLPATFAEWLVGHSNVISDIEGRGDFAQEVDARSWEFAGYCDLTMSPRNLASLTIFARGWRN